MQILRYTPVCRWGTLRCGRINQHDRVNRQVAVVHMWLPRGSKYPSMDAGRSRRCALVWLGDDHAVQHIAITGVSERVSTCVPRLHHVMGWRELMGRDIQSGTMSRPSVETSARTSRPPISCVSASTSGQTLLCAMIRGRSLVSGQ
jgi:hypothetical protein